MRVSEVFFNGVQARLGLNAHFTVESSGSRFWDVGFVLGTAPPVTVYIRGPIKGYIQPYCSYYPTVTEWGQYPSFVDLWFYA